MSPIALIDLDSPLYRAALEAESTEYVSRVAGQYQEHRDKASMLDAVYEHPDSMVWSRTAVGDFALATKALDRAIETFKAELEAKHGGPVTLELYVGGSANFRERLASRIPYKHNRAGKAAPSYLAKLKRYAIEKHGAKRIDFWEVDDELAMRQTEIGVDGCVVVSIDKDLRQLPGNHFIPGKGFLSLTKRSAALNFYAQCIAGDNADGVPGCYQFGMTKAEKALAYLRDDSVPGKEFHARAWATVLACYTNSINTYKEKCGYTDPIAAAVETAQFVYLLRQRPRDPMQIPRWAPL